MRIFRTLLTIGTAAAISLSASAARALEPASIQLKWVYQSQFAGYIVAKNKGFYKAHGLDVTIKPGGPDLAPPQVLAGGGVDFAVDWLPSALAAREKGVPMVNIAQFFTRAGGMITCWKLPGKTKPEEYFKGRTVGVVFFGNEFPFLSFASKLKLSTSGANPDIKIIKLGFNVDPLLQKQADCISTQIYNEYYQLLDHGVKPDQLITFPYADYKADTLEDGLYANGAKLSDPKYAKKAASFLAASIEGWKWAIAHPEETAKIIVDNDPSGVASLPVQTRQMKEIAKLVGAGGSKGVGYLDPPAFDQTVDILMTGGSTPIVTKKPEGAWTHSVYEAAIKEVK